MWMKIPFYSRIITAVVWTLIKHRERSYDDMRSRFVVNNVKTIATSDVKQRQTAKDMGTAPQETGKRLARILNIVHNDEIW